ncbi:fungal specific transcription factor domain-containing protein [Sporobolomyces koalae]|uniref:fungal specific transcription factor domain-containing protein n=1 Tax=Sporobolomyces koalae TaxID=500713 RepID=UPI003180C0F8
MAQAGSHHQESPLVRPSTLDLKRPFEPEPSMAGPPPPANAHHLQQSAGSAAPHPSGTPATKKRITRKRAILSCKNCTSRKIRCERESPGSACKACEKRGDSAQCDPGSVPGSSAGHTPDMSCGDHRADLERRVAQLESMLLGQAPPPPLHRRRISSVTENGVSPRGTERELTRAKSEENLSETEEAALTLEDIAVNVRVSAPQTVRQVAAPPNPHATVATVSAAHGTSRYRESLLVPQISKRWSYVLEDLLSDLPSRPKMDFLIQYYFANIAWFWPPFHAPTFLAEYEAFHQLVQEGRRLEVDPLWLAVLTLVLANSANAIDYLPPGTEFTHEELTGMFARYFENGRAAVECGDGYGTTARIRTIQAVVLLGPLALNSGDPGLVDVLLPYIAAAMRLCQQLGLDKLGTDPNTMPTFQDPALPPGKNTLRREIALRCFHGLCHIDQTIFRCRPVLPMQYVDSAFPGNFHDHELTPDVFCAPHPSNVRTIFAYETLRFRVGSIQRAFHDTVVLDPSYTYANVLDCDTKMRNLLEEYDLERPEPNETTPMFWARIFSLQNINIRLIRFHRPFASKGYRDPAFRKATDLAVAAARVVLETQKELDRTQCPLVKDCYQLNHVQIAIVVLFSTIWYDQDADKQPSADYLLISDSTAMFHRALSSIRERVRNVARQSLLVVQCLFEAFHNQAAHSRKEQYAQVLKRISMIVTEAERRAAMSALDTTRQAANGHAPDPNATLYPHAAPTGPPPQHVHSGGPVDARGVIMTNGAAHTQHGQHHGVHQQQEHMYPNSTQMYAGPLLQHRPSTISAEGGPLPAHSLDYDIGADWGFEWMSLAQT